MLISEFYLFFFYLWESKFYMKKGPQKVVPNSKSAVH